MLTVQRHYLKTRVWKDRGEIDILTRSLHAVSANVGHLRRNCEEFKAQLRSGMKFGFESTDNMKLLEPDQAVAQAKDRQQLREPFSVES